MRADQLDGAVVRLLRDIDEVIHGVAQPRAHRAAIIGAMRVGENLEAPAVVQLEHFDDQPRDRMLLKIRR